MEKQRLPRVKSKTILAAVTSGSRPEQPLMDHDTRTTAEGIDIEMSTRDVSATPVLSKAENNEYEGDDPTALIGGLARPERQEIALEDSDRANDSRIESLLLLKNRLEARRPEITNLCELIRWEIAETKDRDDVELIRANFASRVDQQRVWLKGVHTALSLYNSNDLEEYVYYTDALNSINTLDAALQNCFNSPVRIRRHHRDNRLDIGR